MKSTNPRISVIIPVYNAEKYLEKCLDSVICQELPSVEIVCVDDGSTDACPDILARYARAHDCLRIIRKPNGGLSSARNAGLDAACGEYVFFLDSDDWLAGPDALRGLYERASSLNLDLLLFGADVLYEDNAPAPSGSPNHYRRKGSYPEVANGPDMFCALVEQNEFRASACLLLYRRSFLERNGLRFLPGLIHEDDVFTTQCLSLAERAGYIPAYPYARLVRAGSITTSESALRRAHGYCIGAEHLSRFYDAHLSTADARFSRCYFRRLRDVTERAARFWIGVPWRDRREFLSELPGSERTAMRRWLRRAIPRLYGRALRRRIRKVLPIARK